MKLFDTLADMKASSLQASDIVRTRGKTLIYDGEDAEYFILTPAEYGGTPDELADHTLANGNIAKLIAASTVDIARPASVLVASSLTDQQPAGLGTPLQIEYGAAQGTATDPLSLRADGTVDINESAAYEFITTYSVSRPSAVGLALIFLRFRVNTVQVGNPVGIEIDDNNMTISTGINFIGNFTAGDVLTTEIIRDSGGVDSGGLVSHVSTDGWGNSPSAAVRAFKFG